MKDGSIAIDTSEEGRVRIRMHECPYGLKQGSEVPICKLSNAYDLSLAEQMGASGTPAFFVNGTRQVGWGSYMALKSMVAREIAQAKELISGGVKPADVIRRRIESTANSNSKDEGETVLDGKLWARLLLTNL